MATKHFVSVKRHSYSEKKLTLAIPIGDAAAEFGPAMMSGVLREMEGWRSLELERDTLGALNGFDAR